MKTVTATASPKKKKSQGRGRSNSLPCHVVEYLKNWLMSPEHINHPYPSESEKARMVAETGIEIKRLNNWFVNNRIRFWKPRFEAMQKQQELKKRKLSESNESIISLETNSKPSPRGTRSITPSPKQDAIQVIVPSPKIYAPSLDLGHLVHTITTASATVSDDDSYSSNYSSKFVRNSSKNQDFHNTTIFRRCRKRQRTQVENGGPIETTNTLESSRRFKCNFNDVEQWKLACLGSFSSCPELNETNLPSLDDAVQLFGYSQ